MKGRFSAFIVLFFTCCHFAAFPQSRILQAELLKFIDHSDSIINKYPAEKLYLHFDKPEYIPGDTIWLKAYVFNAASHLLSSRSGLLHVDIANDSDKVVKQYLFSISNGLVWGNIALDEKTFREGNYNLRAYTNWMRNFGDIFYYKNIRIAGTGEHSWLVNTKINADNNTIVRTQLQLTDLDKKPFSDSTLQVEVMEGKKVMYKQNVQTDKNGLVDMSFVRTPKMNNPAIVIQNKGKTRKAIIPVSLNRQENTDVQFMPEGGSLVAGLPAHIGFKAISENGKGVDVNGIVVDKAGKQVVAFNSLHKGIGSFELLPRDDEIYTAKVSLPGGTVKDYSLPVAKTSGTALRVRNAIESDSVGVSLSATNDLVQSGNSYFLIAKARGVVCYAAVVSFHHVNEIRKAIAKNLFPTGITHFILMTPQGQPLNERLVYIDQHDDLQINIEPGQSVYAPKDSVALNIMVTDNAGKPVAGNFSLAVTDDTQVKADSSGNDNILTRLLLTSDLKGYVEEPGYYFSQNKAAEQALDNLLLTQGWVNYEPADIKMPYLAETEYTVKGRVDNVFNKPVKKTNIILFSKTPSILMDTTTNNEGRFTFDRFPRVDTPVFVLKAVNRGGKSFNVNIDVDEYVPPLFSAPKTPLTMPWYINSDSTLMNHVKDNIMVKKLQDYFPGSGRQLKEVKITAKKIIKDSQNLNGAGNADVVLDEKDLEAAGKKTFLDLLNEKVKGFREGEFCFCPKGAILFHFVTDDEDLQTYSRTWYFIDDKPVKFIIDGVPKYEILPLTAYAQPFFDITDYLKSHDAEDIKGIEVNSTTKYTYRYVPMKWSMAIQPNDVAFVEITTRSGSGPGIKNTPGLYLYKPLPISWPKQFYKPKYTVSDTSKRIDLRSMIDWEPNIVTDSTGKATISFYAGSEPSTYTIIAEGTDLNGNIGYKQRKIIVKRKETAKSK